MDELIPSWLTSWIVWRNRYTTPEGLPFDKLKQDFGFTRVPTGAEYLIRVGGQCPFCKGDEVINHETMGLIYCLCYILDWQYQITDEYKSIRSVIHSATLQEMTIPVGINGEAKRTLLEAKQAAAEFIVSPDKWLIFCGVCGSGKTHILRAITTALQPIAIYTTAHNIESFTHSTRKEDILGEYIESLQLAPILLIDDFGGQEYGGKLYKSIIDRVIDFRYERYPDNPVVVASNMNAKGDEFSNYLPRTGDRLTDVSRTKILGLRTSSYRQISVGLR